MSYTLQEFPNTVALVEATVQLFATTIQQAVAQKGLASAVFSGGTTPKLFLPALRQLDLPWEKVYLTLADERWVDNDHPDSNEKLLQDYLLQGPAARAHFFPLKYPAEDVVSGAVQADAALQAFPQPVDVLFLGMGADGHTLSWFPGAAGLTEALDRRSHQRVVAVQPKTVPQARLTLTLAMVLRAQRIVLHLQGVEKKAVLQRVASDLAAQRGVDRDHPVRVILRQQQVPVTIFWAP